MPNGLIPGRSDSGASLVFHQGYLFAFWRAPRSDTRVFFTKSQDNGASWVPQAAIAGLTSTTRPAAGEVGFIYVAGLRPAGQSGPPWLTFGDDSGWWLPPLEIGPARSSASPALLGVRFLHPDEADPTGISIWRGETPDVQLRWSQLYSDWTPPQSAPGASHFSPSASVFHNRAVVAWLDAEPGGRMKFASFDGTTWRALPDLPGRSDAAPAIAAYGGKVHAVWVGAAPDGQAMFYSTFDGNVWSAQRGIGYAKTFASPSLVATGDRVIMAWQVSPTEMAVTDLSPDGKYWTVERSSAGLDGKAGPTGPTNEPKNPANPTEPKSPTATPQPVACSVQARQISFAIHDDGTDVVWELTGVSFDPNEVAGVSVNTTAPNPNSGQLVASGAVTYPDGATNNSGQFLPYQLVLRRALSVSNQIVVKTSKKSASVTVA